MTAIKFRNKIWKKFGKSIHSTKGGSLIYQWREENKELKLQYIPIRILQHIPKNVISNAKTFTEVHEQLQVYKQIFKK